MLFDGTRLPLALGDILLPGAIAGSGHPLVHWRIFLCSFVF